ncbi:MAG TPA: hypothetical protein VGE67_01925 [Haloferula sp.]
MGLKEAIKLAGSIPVQIMVGYMAMVLVIERVAVPHRDQFHYFCVGIPFAVFVFISGVLAGSMASVFVYADVKLLPDFIWLCFWIILFGALPAAAFGVIATCLLRKVRNASQPIELHLKRP